MATGDALNLTGYKLTFDDEFNSFSSNGPANPSITGGTGTWDTTYSYGERHLNDEQEFYSDPTVGVNPDSASGGVLDIHAAPATSATNTGGLPYTSGVITTDHSFNQEYGYFEMRAELPQGAGLWPAFWLLPQVHGWPPELDPLEAFGATNNGSGGANTYHTGLVTSDPTISNQNQWDSTNGANLYNSYNTFGVQWSPTTITFFFNGAAYYTVPTPSDFHQSMYMIANLAVGGNWPGSPNGESADLKIDYIRAFSNDGANPAIVQQTISSPDGGGKTFYGATDKNGNGATGGGTITPPVVPPVTPPAITTLGSGADTLALKLSEDAYQGDAQFTISIDGKQIGGTQTATASHAAAAVQEFDVKGTFAAGQHSVAINFLNDKYDGSASTDRNLYLDSASMGGKAVAGASLSLMSSGAQSFAFQGAGAPPLVPPVTPPAITTLGSGADTLALKLSEDAYQGDAQFTISIDGKQIGGTQTTPASHAAGAVQEFDVKGTFAPGQHSMAVNFLNDKYDGSASTDRNLYLDSASMGGKTVAGASLSLMSSGAQSISFQGPAAVTPPATGSLVLHLAEDAYQGNAQFTVAVDGHQLGLAQAVATLNSTGGSQAFTFNDLLPTGTHDLAVTFTNDAYGGTPDTDRNLYVNSADYGGTAISGATTALYSNGTQHYAFTV